MSAININKNNFQNEIMDSEKTVLLDFWAPWCAPLYLLLQEIIHNTYHEKYILLFNLIAQSLCKCSNHRDRKSVV